MMPEDYIEQTMPLCAKKEREYVASTVDTEEIVELPLGRPALQIIVDAQMHAELEVQKSLVKAENADM